MTYRNPSDLIDGLLPATSHAEPCAPDTHDGERKPLVKRRAYTESMKRLGKAALHRGAADHPPSINAEYEADRPKTLGDCLPGGCNEARPCPWVSCKWSLVLDVSTRTGSIKHNFPDFEVWQMPDTCALDIADRGGMTLEEMGDTLGKTREGIRQIEVNALAKILASRDAVALSDYTADDFDVWQAAPRLR